MDNPHRDQTTALAAILFSASSAQVNSSRVGLHFHFNRDTAKRAFPCADVTEAELRAAIAGEILRGEFPW